MSTIPNIVNMNYIQLFRCLIQYHKNTQSLWQNRHIIKHLILAQSEVYFTCIKPLWWLIPVPNMNTIHDSSRYILLQVYNIYEIMDINATCWHIAKVYSTCFKPLMWLITVPNLNKINPFFSEIYHKHTCMKKWPSLLKFGTEPNAIILQAWPKLCVLLAVVILWLPDIVVYRLYYPGYVICVRCIRMTRLFQNL